MITLCRKGRFTTKSNKSKKEKRGEAPNSPERMAKTAQVLSNLNENFFDSFDFAVKKLCGSSLAPHSGGAPKTEKANRTSNQTLP
jgi:hypothetical protein